MKGYRHHAYSAVFAALMLLGAPGAAMAACTSPSGNAGAITWNGTDSVIWCDGTNWYALKNAAGSSGSAGYIQFSNGSGGFSNSGTTAGQQLFWDDTNKWLGLGTATPVAKLGIAVTDTTTYSMTGLSTIPSGSTGLSIINQNNSDAGYAGLILQNRLASVASGQIAVTGGSSTSALTFGVRPTSGAVALYEYMRITHAGRVGIGTAAPSTDLAFGGEAARTIGMERTSAGTNGYSLTLQAGGAKSATADLNGGDLTLSSGTATGTGSSNIYFKTAAAGTTGTTDRVPGTAMTILGNNNVGIGTTTPAFKLHLSEPGYLGLALTRGSGGSYVMDITNDYGLPTGSLNIVSNDATNGNIGFRAANSGNAQMVLLASGNVGIGTTAPTALLHLAANRSATSWTTTGSNLHVAGGTQTDTSGTGTIATRVVNSFSQPTLASSNAVTVTNAANVYIAGAPAAGTNTTITNSNALHVAAGSSYFGGNVGIGTTSPTTPLSVSTAQGTSGGILVADATDANNPRVQLRTSNPNGNGVIEVLDSTEAVKIQLHGNGASYITSGNLGIGTTSPATSLHVSSGNAAGLIVERPATLNAGMEFRQTGGSIFAGIATGLDFAIGAGNNLEASLFKVSSAGKLKISAPDNTATQLSLISDRRAIVSSDLIGGLDFQSNDSQLTAPGTVAASIKALASATHTASELGTDLTFSTTTGTTFAERMRVTAAGNVGIGTTSPSEALTVNGNPEFQGASKKLRIVPDSTGITYLQVGTDNTDATGEIRLTRYKTTSTSFAKFSSYATTNYLAGNVGIGITTPAAALHVSGTDSTAYVSSSASAYSPADLSSPAAPMVLIANTANLDGQGVYLNLLSKNAVADGQRAYIGAISNSTGRSPNIVVGQQNGTTSYIERMRIAAGGNVGIGTTTPAAKLDVNGFMRLAKNGSAPATCDATIDGAIALTSARRMCVCDATSWVEVNSATACTW